MLITSTSNQTIKDIRALQHRKERERTGLFFVEGIRVVGEAIQLQASIDALIAAPELLTSEFARQLIADQERRNTRIIEVSPSVFESISGKDGPQGIAAVIHQSWHKLETVRPREELCWIALDASQDPGNIGTILRTSDAVGSAGLILIGNSADPYDPGCVRASMGALFAQRLIRTTFDELIRWKRQHGYSLIGTSDRGADDYQAIDYNAHRPLILLMGSERLGLSPQQQAACDAMARIPMTGRSDSLNLAVATAVMLYEIFNQHRR